MTPRPVLLAALTATACAPLVACLTALPRDPDPRHLAIAWRHDVDAALREARATHKPLLIVGAAGDLVGPC